MSWIPSPRDWHVAWQMSETISEAETTDLSAFRLQRHEELASALSKRAQPICVVLVDSVHEE